MVTSYQADFFRQGSAEIIPWIISPSCCWHWVSSGISKFWASMESEQHVIQGWTKDGPHHLGKLGEHIVVETYMDIEGEREIRTCYMCWKHEHPQNPQIWTLLLTNPKLPGHLLAWRLVVPVAVLVKSQNGNNEKNKRTNHVDLPRLVMKCVRGWDQ